MPLGDERAVYTACSRCKEFLVVVRVRAAAVVETYQRQARSKCLLVCIRMYASMCVCMHVYIYICMYVSIHTHTHIYIYIYVFMYAYECIYACLNYRVIHFFFSLNPRPTLSSSESHCGPCGIVLFSSMPSHACSPFLHTMRYSGASVHIQPPPPYGTSSHHHCCGYGRTEQL